MKPEDVPVLIIPFRRPDKIKQVIAALALVKPKYVYVLCDGPRPNNEMEAKQVEEARAISTNLPWDCEIKTNFKETNVGLTPNIVSGIDWFFDNVEMGIILEDDCIPDPSFFSFCAELLEYYKDDKSIMHISGNNFHQGKTYGDGSYFFSHYSHSWGWATWRRAWRLYHEANAHLPEYLNNNRLDELPFTKSAKSFWHKVLSNTNIWDSRWLYTTWYFNGLCILPNRNLVSNIGFGHDATHTKEVTAQAFVANQSIEKIVHPSVKEVSVDADDFTFREMFYVPIYKRIKIKLNAIMAKYL